MKKREELIEQINIAGRKMSTAEVIFHQALAEKAGLSGADHKYLDLLLQEGPMTAGRLSQLTGLTTGAVTGLINRLEKGDLVKRENDPGDRRKVLVVPQIENAMSKLGPIFAEMQGDLNNLYSHFNMDELETIHKYLAMSFEFFSEQIKKLKKKGG